jgi:hypothetical protein
MASKQKRAELDEAVKAFLADLVENDQVVTFGDEAEAVLKNRRAAQAVGQIHARLSREYGGRYPGTERVVTKEGEVVGPVTQGEAVEQLRQQGRAIQRRGNRFFTSLG